MSHIKKFEQFHNISESKVNENSSVFDGLSDVLDSLDPAVLSKIKTAVANGDADTLAKVLANAKMGTNEGRLNEEAISLSLVAAIGGTLMTSTGAWLALTNAAKKNPNGTAAKIVHSLQAAGKAAGTVAKASGGAAQID